MSAFARAGFSAALCICAASLMLLSPLHAQRPRGPQDAVGPGASGRAAAPIDLTGYWAALITDDWQYRMIVPAKGDYSWLPINAAARQLADAWDPERDEAQGEACKAYAAPAIMRLPTRLRISWEDDATLRVETDTGTQTRSFYFDQRPPQGERTWQGHSTAEWNLERPANLRRRVFEDTAERSDTNAGSLRVQTRYLRSGYLRKNGVPFSAQAEMIEYFNVLIGQRGERYLAVQTYVEDPVYLNRQFVRTLLFKHESDGSKWNPTACAADGWASN